MSSTVSMTMSRIRTMSMSMRKTMTMIMNTDAPRVTRPLRGRGASRTRVAARAWRGMRPLAIRAIALGALAVLRPGADASSFAMASAIAHAHAHPAPAAATAPPARWNERLGRLDPLRPLDYLQLGEEVADAATTEEELALARTLFGYAGALDTARLGRSAMLALAAIAPNDLERSRALAAAEIVGGRGLARGAERVEPAQIASLSRAFSFHRRGDGRRALSALRQDDADALLESLDAAIPGGAQAFRDEARAMRSSGGLATDESAIRRLEDIELALRLGPLRPVSLDLVVAGDAPLVEIDLADPASVWRVDPARPWWRDGAWSGRG
ncbi:MAG: hypothetical protein RI967_1603 [Planctomycetota bacterium]